MDHGKLCGPVQKSENREERMKENTSMSVEAKVGLADEAIAIISSGQKDRVHRRERLGT